MEKLKKCQWLLLFVFVCVAALTSCDDDDDNEGRVKQGFRVDDGKYSLTKAYTTIFDQGEEVFTHQIILAGDGLEVTEGPEFDGKSSVASFTLFTDSEELEAGEYLIRDNPNEPGEASLIVAYVNYDADGDDEDFERAFAGTGASINVARQNDTYTFSVKCPTVLTIVSTAGTPIFLPVDGDLQIHYSGEVTDITTPEVDLRKPSGSKLFLP